MTLSLTDTYELTGGTQRVLSLHMTLQLNIMLAGFTLVLQLPDWSRGNRAETTEKDYAAAFRRKRCTRCTRVSANVDEKDKVRGKDCETETCSKNHGRKFKKSKMRHFTHFTR